MSVRRARQTPAEAVATVERLVSAYAARGLFRGFGCRRVGDAALEFRFRWLTELPCVLVFDAQASTLTLRNLLPGVPYPSAMDRELRRFVAERSRGDRLAHRRIDPGRLDVRLKNRRGSVSIVARCHDGDWAYAVRRTVSLVNEIFLGFLSGPWEEYMVQTFQTPEE